MEMLTEIPSFWYLGQPYTAHSQSCEVAYRQGCEAAGWLIDRGVPIFSPIAHSHPIAMIGKVKHDCYDTWLSLDERLMEGAHGLLVLELPGYETSKGLNWERAWFKERHRPIVFLPWPLRNAEQ